MEMWLSPMRSLVPGRGYASQVRGKNDSECRIGYLREHLLGRALAATGNLGTHRTNSLSLNIINCQKGDVMILTCPISDIVLFKKSKCGD